MEAFTVRSGCLPELFPGLVCPLSAVVTHHAVIPPPAKGFAHHTCCAGFNYLQSVTPNLALGGETFWLSQAMKSGVGFAARHQGDKHIATAQIATTGLVSLNYAHRLSEKVGKI